MLQGLGGQSCTRHLTDCPEGRNCSLPRGPVTMFACVSHRGHSGFLPDGNERIPHPRRPVPMDADRPRGGGFDFRFLYSG